MSFVYSIKVFVILTALLYNTLFIWVPYAQLANQLVISSFNHKYISVYQFLYLHKHNWSGSNICSTTLIELLILLLLLLFLLLFVLLLPLLYTFYNYFCFLFSIVHLSSQSPTLSICSICLYSCCLWKFLFWKDFTQLLLASSLSMVSNQILLPVKSSFLSFNKKIKF